MEKEEVKLFTDIFEDKSFPARRWMWDWKWKSFLFLSLSGYIISLFLIAVAYFFFDQKVISYYRSIIYFIAGNMIGCFIVYAIKVIRLNWNFFYEYRYKIYAYSLLVGVGIAFFRHLILLYDLIK